MRVDSITLTEKVLGSHSFGYKHEGYTNIAGFMEKMMMTTEHHHGIFSNFGAPYFQTKPYSSSVKIGGQDPGTLGPGHQGGERISAPKIVSQFEWF